MTRLLMLVLFIFTYFDSSALAYLKDYPPYKFKDGPPDHLQVQALIDSTKSEYVSSDRKILASLKKTKSGIELLVKDNTIIVVSKKTNKFPVPYAVYHTDIDGDGLNDFIVFYNYRDWFRNGIKEDRVEIFLKQNEGTYQMIAYDAISVGLEDFVDLNGDGKYEVIITKMNRIKGHSYFIYSIYEFDGFRLLNSDAKFKSFSKFVRYFRRPNDNDDLSLPREKRLALSDSNNKAIQQKAITSRKTPALIKPKEIVANKVGELNKELSQKSEAIKALEDKEQKLIAWIEAKERKFQKDLVSEKNNQKMLETRFMELYDRFALLEKNMNALEEDGQIMQGKLETKIKKLTEASTLRDKTIKKLKDGEQGLRVEFENSKLKFKNVLDEKEKEYQEVLETRVEELSEKLFLLDVTIQALEEENQNLQSSFETKETEFEEMFAAKDKQRQDVFESKIRALEDNVQELRTHFEDKESQLQEDFADMNKETMEVRIEDLSGRLAAFNKHLNALEEEGRNINSSLETRTQELSDKLTVFDMTIQALKEENQKLQTRFESKGKEYQDALITKDREFHAFLENKIKELSEKWLKSLGSLSEEKSLVNVGTVDMQRVIEESTKGREARMFFEGLISLRSEEDLTKTERKLISQIVKDIEVVVQQYAREHGIIYIVDGVSGGVIHINKKLDITDEIIDLYNKMVKPSNQEEAAIK